MGGGVKEKKKKKRDKQPYTGSVDMSAVREEIQKFKKKKKTNVRFGMQCGCRLWAWR